MISCCLIVKDESAVIERCLGWLAPVVGDQGEIVLLDTGSTDDTGARAQRFGERVGVRVRWEQSIRFRPSTPPEDFHFACARNECLLLATGPWLFWCDADDVMEGPSVLALVNLLRSQRLGSAPAYRFAYAMADGSEYMRLRLFRRELGLRFHGACHECITPPQGTQDIRSIRLIHAPPPRPVGGRASGSIRLRLLEREAQEEGRRNARTLFYLANEQRNLGLLWEAVATYERYLALSRWAEERHCARLFMAECRAALGERDRALDDLAAARKEDPRFADSLVLTIRVALDANREAGGGGSRKYLEIAEEALAKLRLLPFPEEAIMFTNRAFYTREFHDRIEGEIRGSG